MNRFIVAVVACALLAAGCSTHAVKDNAPSSAEEPADHTATKSTGHVGDTLNLTRADGSKIAVTLTRVINPVTVSDGQGEAGKTYLATQLTIADTGTTPVEGDVNVNVSVVGSDDLTYTPELNDVAECTNFDSGTFHLSTGKSASGCVVFALPSGVSPAKVQYKPSAGFADDSGEWLVP